MAKSTEQLVLEKMDQLLRITTIGVARGLKQGEQILLLSRSGFPPKEIADLLGTTSNTVSVALYASRKGKTSKLKTRKDRARSGKT